MAGAGDRDGPWETQAEVDACLRETGVTANQVKRWRREGLLPPEVEQLPQGYRGSIVKYPFGTCAQIKAAQDLFKQKDRVEYVAFGLWWQGFWVKEDHWRSRLQKQAKTYDRVLKLIPWLRLRDDRSEESPTSQERVATLNLQNIILSRVWRRTSGDGKAALCRVLLDLSDGQFDGFDTPEIDDVRSLDEEMTIKALDFEGSENHQILGQKMNSIAILSSALKNVGVAMSSGSFSESANAPTSEINLARDDLRNALRIGWAMYDALRWIYGPEAFGLRLAHWIVEKAPNATKLSLILPMMKLRAIPGAIWPSDEIARQTTEVLKVRDHSLGLKKLWEENPRYKSVLNPKRIKAAFADQISLKRWQEEVRAISMERQNKLRSET